MLSKVHVNNPETTAHFQMGYCSGLAEKIISEHMRQSMTALKLLYHGKEHFKNSIVIPAFNENNTIVDLFGMRYMDCDRIRSILWQEPTRGLIGIQSFKIFGEMIVVDVPYFLLQIFDFGYKNVVSIRRPNEIRMLKDQIDKNNTQRVFVMAKNHGKVLTEQLKKTGIDVVRLQTPSTRKVERGLLDPVGRVEGSGRESELKLVDQNDSYLVFQNCNLNYRVDSTAMVGLGYKAQVKASAGKEAFRDKIDLASYSSRFAYAKTSGVKLGVPASTIESHLSKIADEIDSIQAESKTEIQLKYSMDKQETEDAMLALNNGDILKMSVDTIEEHLHYVGETDNVKLAALVAASRLTDKPIGGIIRGPAGCGKSALQDAVCKITPNHLVKEFSRITSQSLHYMEQEQLSHKLLVIDEYTGGAKGSDYSLRTMLSSQKLSMAVSVRESGQVPVTKNIELDAKVSFLSSTTGAVEPELLTRLVAIRLNPTPLQSKLVMIAMAEAKGSKDSKLEIQKMKNIYQLLKPCRVIIPFAKQLAFASTHPNSRRIYGIILQMISSHAAMHQYQRKTETINDEFVVYASFQDYKAIHPLIEKMTEKTVDEEITGTAGDLLAEIQSREATTVTQKEAMIWLNQSPSKVYRAIKKLVKVELLTLVKGTHGPVKVPVISSSTVFSVIFSMSG